MFDHSHFFANRLLVINCCTTLFYFVLSCFVVFLFYLLTILLAFAMLLLRLTLYIVRLMFYNKSSNMLLICCLYTYLKQEVLK